MKILRFALGLSILYCCQGCGEDAEIVVNYGEEVSSVIDQVAPIFHNSHEPKKKDAPFSDAVQVGNTFYLSGQIGMDHHTREVVGGGIEEETKQALENIREVLNYHKLNLDDVVKVTVFLNDINDFMAFNGVYVQYLSHKPARSTVAVEALAKGASIEIEVVAVKSVHARGV